MPDPKKRYLILSDFDGTLVDTFSPSPNHVGVHEAYSMAVQDVFGDEGVRTFESIGGLQNRATGELVAEILRESPNLLEKARTFAAEKGYAWNEAEPQKVITEMIVEAKLGKIMGEIGSKFPDGRVWPELYPGVAEFFKKVEEINAKGEVGLDLGILSSGHTKFIEKTFSLWNIKPPQILVTDDDIRERKYPEEPFRRVKPSAFLFALAHFKWLKSQGVTPRNFDLDGAMELRNRAMYIGDDPVKDGDLAREAKVPFCLFDRKNKKSEGWDGKDRFSFEDWNELDRILGSEEVSRSMGEGKSFSEILRPQFEELQTELKRPRPIEGEQTRIR